MSTDPINAVNLDTLIIRIKGVENPRERVNVKLPEGRSLDHYGNIPLNRFIKQDGRASVRRLSSDFDYEEFRKFLEINKIVKRDVFLDPGPPSSVLDSTNSWYVLLARVQSGEHPLTEKPDGFKYLRLGPPSENTAPAPAAAAAAVPAGGGGGGGGVGPGPVAGRRTLKPSELGSPFPGSLDKVISTPTRRPAPPAGGALPARRGAGGGPTPGRDLASGTRPVPSSAKKEVGINDMNSIVEGTNVIHEDDEDKSNADVDESSMADGANAIVNQLNINQAQIDSTTWESVCQFFGCNTNDTEVEVPGLKLRLRGYQMHAVYWMIMQPLRNIRAGMIGDDVGLGKTGMTLAVIVLRHQMHTAAREVSLEWAQRKVIEKQANTSDPVPQFNHLPNQTGVQTPITTCPSQAQSRFRFICPCVPGSVAFRFTRQTMSAPSIIIAPADLLDQVRDIENPLHPCPYL